MKTLERWGKPLVAMGLGLCLLLVAACSKDEPLLLSTCGDGIKNGDEGGIDCGGSCTPCLDGSSCRRDGDCLGGRCAGEVCTTPHCGDGALNGAETDLDCGGPCPRCMDGKRCNEAPDCRSDRCIDEKCEARPSCSDEVMNGDESDLDCGGSCGGCDLDRACLRDDDCLSGRCVDRTCAQAIRCSDLIWNGDESDTDCGGSCLPCSDGRRCREDEDCAGGTCSRGLCDSGLMDGCTNGIQDGDETDIDCGGSCRGRYPCPSGFRCLEGDDCGGEMSWCEEGVCGGPWVCFNGERDGRETGVDCGGPICVPCGADEPCGEDGDCLSGECGAGSCTAPEWTCDDRLRNERETDIDCGGGVCPGCATGSACEHAYDCEILGDCQATDKGVRVCGGQFACADGLMNGQETDLDCGGAACLPCRGGGACVVPADCGSERCEDGICELLALTCGDGERNGSETDRDCGGRGCHPCPDASTCLRNEDCAGNRCEGTCRPSVVGIQRGEASLDCTASGLITVQAGIAIDRVIVSSSAFRLDDDCDGFYVMAPEEDWLDPTNGRFAGILVAVDRGRGFIPSKGSWLRLVGDHRERDCMTELYVGLDGTISHEAGRPPQVQPTRLDAAEFAAADAAGRESLEGTLVAMGSATVASLDGYSGPESPGAPNWWFSLEGEILVANDFGLSVEPPPVGTALSVHGFVKQEQGVYLLVPHDPAGIVPGSGR